MRVTKATDKCLPLKSMLLAEVATWCKCLFTRENKDFMISACKIVNHANVPTLNSSPDRQFNYTQVFSSVSDVEAELSDAIVCSPLPPRLKGHVKQVDHMICMSCIFIREWIQFKSTLNIISKHFQPVLECPTPLRGDVTLLRHSLSFVHYLV